MKDERDSVFNWFLYNVIVVIVPVFTCELLSSIYNGKPPAQDEILNNIILLLLSILCSILSTTHEKNGQIENYTIKIMYRIALALGFVIWSIYIVFLTHPFDSYIFLIIILSLIIFICFYLGIIITKKICDIENERIQKMHNNCSIIREKMFRADYDKSLDAHANRSSDLLCDPDNFDRVQIAINIFLEKKDREE